MILVVDIIHAIEFARFRFSGEDELQRAVELALERLGCRFDREHRFDERSRVDFFLPDLGLAIEIKVDGSVVALARQVLRYARVSVVQEILVVTTRAAHREVPSVAHGKPVRVVHLLRSAL